MQDTSLLPTFVKLWMSFWWVEVINVRCSFSFGLRKVGIGSHSLGLFQATLREAETSLALGNSCSHHYELVSFDRLGHSWPSYLWLWIMEIGCLCFTSIYACFLLFTYVYFCLSKPVFLLNVTSGNQLPLFLFTLIFFCLLMFTFVYQNIIPLGTRTEYELWRLDVFVLLLFSFIFLFTFVYSCL